MYAQSRRYHGGDTKLNARAMQLSRKELEELSQLVPDPKSDDLFDPGGARFSGTGGPSCEPPAAFPALLGPLWMESRQ